VKVQLTKPDTTLRPGMTTSNAIETFKIKDALYVPIESVMSDSVGVAVVYKRDGSRVVKQEVETGTMSDDEVVVLRGLTEEDRVLLAPPPNHETMTVARLTGPSLRPKDVPGDSARATVLQAGGGAGPSAPAAPAPAPPAKKP
jgi:multidrug efflux pump subunit AcrA (membrane-fusion protein)